MGLSGPPGFPRPYFENYFFRALSAVVGILNLDKKQIKILEQCLVVWCLFLGKRKKKKSLQLLLHGEGIVGAREARRPVG